MFLLFYATFYACWHYVYRDIFELRPLAPSHLSAIGGVFVGKYISFGARGLSVVRDSEVVRHSGAVNVLSLRE